MPLGVTCALLAACSAAPITPAPTAQVPPTSPPAALTQPDDATPTPAVEATPAPRPTVEARLLGVAPTPTAAIATRPALQPLVEGLSKPTELTTAPGSKLLYVTEQVGRVRVIQANTLLEAPFLDITDRVGSRASEQGLLGIAFASDFPTSRRFFVNYTDRSGATVISAFLAQDDLRADPNSEWVVMRIPQPYANHNGGQIQFGPDGMLYVATGDGGSAGDPQNLAQNVNSLLGKLLRLDVSQSSPDEPYRVPPDNPDFGPNSLPEIWAIGLRNPWRFSFDRATGDLYIADVGQNRFEEINFAPAGTGGGRNYGWKLREGFSPFASQERHTSLTDPIWQYDHSDGHCSVTGGYVYRGRALPGLIGSYLYGDFCSGVIWGLQRSASGEWQNTELMRTGLLISAFGQDADGELYVLDHRGAVYRIVAAD